MAQLEIRIQHRPGRESIKRLLADLPPEVVVVADEGEAHNPYDLLVPTKGSGRRAHIRVLEKTKRDGECWVYTGWKQTSGYGRITLGPGDRPGTATAAHRAVYEALVGPIPDEYELDHICRNRACVNPDHLEPVTHAENVRRGYWGKDHCKHGHPYDDTNTRWGRSRKGPGQPWRSVRFCRQCQRGRDEKRRHVARR